MPAAVVPAPAPAPMVTSPRPGALSPDDEARLRAALHQAAADLEAKEKSGAVAVTAPGTPAQPIDTSKMDADAALKKKLEGEIAVQQTPPGNQNMDPEARKKLEAELMARQLAAEQADTEAKQKMAAEAAQAARARKDAEMGAKGGTMASGNPAPVPPAAMIPGSKEQRLYDLLQLYKADKITPIEYHEQRAKIVNEP